MRPSKLHASESFATHDGTGIPYTRCLERLHRRNAALLSCRDVLGCRLGSSWLSVIVVAVLYGIIMNSAYSTIHEAEHNLFHTNGQINVTAGVVLALFFPAPFHLIRQGHIGHHLRNRSDDEAFDLYFDEDKPIWRWLYWGR